MFLLFEKLGFLFETCTIISLLCLNRYLIYFVRKMYCFTYKYTNQELYIWCWKFEPQTEDKPSSQHQQRQKVIFCISGTIQCFVNTFVTVEDSGIMMKVYISLIPQSSELNWIKLKTSQSALLLLILNIIYLDNNLIDSIQHQYQNITNIYFITLQHTFSARNIICEC